MQREQADAFNSELKEAISDVKTHEYKRKLLVTLDPAVLRLIDYRVRTESQLTMLDRLQLLSEIERLEMSADPEKLSGRERSFL